jgi:argininosuccinate lyase
MGAVEVGLDGVSAYGSVGMRPLEQQVVENAYDANHLAPVDTALEVAAALGIAAVQIGQFAQDLHAQYAVSEPWMTLQRGELVGVSSIMP